MATPKKIIVQFDIDTYPDGKLYITKNTVRFKERAEEGKHVMGKVYVQKEDLKTLGDPKTLEVEIRPGK
jgi:hypothetical protein